MPIGVDVGLDQDAVGIMANYSRLADRGDRPVRPNAHAVRCEVIAKFTQFGRASRRPLNAR